MKKYRARGRDGRSVRLLVIECAIGSETTMYERLEPSTWMQCSDGVSRPYGQVGD